MLVQRAARGHVAQLGRPEIPLLPPDVCCASRARTVPGAHVRATLLPLCAVTFSHDVPPVVASALLESVSAFQASTMKVSTKAVGATMFSEGDLGVLPPLGVYDPLGLIETRGLPSYLPTFLPSYLPTFLHVHRRVARRHGLLLNDDGSRPEGRRRRPQASLEAIPTAVDRCLVAAHSRSAQQGVTARGSVQQGVAARGSVQQGVAACGSTRQHAT